MDEILKELIITTLNITEELYATIDENNCKRQLLCDIAVKSNLDLKPEEIEKIFKNELGW